jgi:hypothetical protein
MDDGSTGAREGDEATPRPVRRSRLRRWGPRVLLVLVLVFAGGELFARYYLGLGDPPLMMADPQIEYLAKPDQDCRRFGNHVRYNHYSMRSDDFPAHKADPRELRVLVIGDSVVNGGVLSDQSKIATSVLQRKLRNELNRPVVVANISAGSWGPPNELAYLKRFGLFDADVMVIVLSSHDYADVPTFAPTVGVDPSSPDHRPVLALWEGFTRYLLPRLGYRKASNEGYTPATAPAKSADVAWSMAALREMIDMGRRAGLRVILAQHLERAESLASPLPGHGVIADEARRDGLAPIELGAAFDAARRRGQQPYRDDIHPNDLGQAVIAEALLPAIERAVGAAPTTAPAATGRVTVR